MLAEVVLCAVGRVAPLPADGDDGAKHCLARAGDEPSTIYTTSSILKPNMCFIVLNKMSVTLHNVCPVSSVFCTRF